MSKRRAGTELTRDNWDEEEEKIEVGTFQVADESVLKNRIVKRAKRTLKRDESGEPKSIFSGFSGFGNLGNNTKQAFSFLSNCNKKSDIPNSNGNHPLASTTNSMTMSSSLKFSENESTKSSNPTLVDPVKVMKLNEAFVKFITNAVQKNPYCVLTPTLKDYEKQISKFVAFNEVKSNTTNTSSESPQISTSENTFKNTKDSEEMKKSFDNAPTTANNFINSNSNTKSSGFSFNFENNINSTIVSKKEDSNKETKKEKEKIETDTKIEPLGNLKNTSSIFSGLKSNDSKLISQPFSFSTKTPNFEANKMPPSINDNETKQNTPSFNFGSNVPQFSLNATDKNNSKPFFSFGEKSVAAPSNIDLSKNSTDSFQPAQIENDEDQPPVVNFTPIKENDAIFESKSKLYVLKDGKYEELGIGQLYLKKVDNKKIQLIMRNDSALGTIMANTLLNDTVNFVKRNSKNIQLICILDPTKNTKPQTVLFKFKDSQDTDLFENELSKLKN
ncbi:nuclear pore complex protein Nup50 [Daktulosphaira vitifoliae]|uniref:nuclear pore complex protein Nup50 n=1 Tax=Daktulosphaira vitifoliae TaxID=58002 RepID=UPI0021AB0127|nr:nuclear pore complex protein Nup50 [Daktulosphaira vitifoliae]